MNDRSISRSHFYIHKLIKCFKLHFSGWLEFLSRLHTCFVHFVCARTVNGVNKHLRVSQPTLLCLLCVSCKTISFHLHTIECLFSRYVPKQWNNDGGSGGVGDEKKKIRNLQSVFACSSRQSIHAILLQHQNFPISLWWLNFCAGNY